MLTRVVVEIPPAPFARHMADGIEGGVDAGLPLAPLPLLPLPLDPAAPDPAPPPAAMLAFTTM